MMTKTPTRKAAAAAGLLIALGFAAAPASVLAQQKASVSRSETVSGKVTIKSIDQATRHVVVTNSDGENTSMKVPPEMHNLDQLKVGDTINATYTLEAEIVLSAPNSKLPPDTETLIAARAAKGELPAGAVANHIVVTGAVVGVDKAKRTLKIVSPQGGEVHTAKVTSADGVKALDKVKVGDTITVYLTESLLMAANPG
jgi:ribosomal protein S1